MPVATSPVPFPSTARSLVASDPCFSEDSHEHPEGQGAERGGGGRRKGQQSEHSLAEDDTVLIGEYCL